MFRSWKIARLFDIDIYLHWSFVLLLIWVYAANAGTSMGAFVVTVVLALFGCVVLHELGHALAARHFGIGTRDITLYPIGGVARLERMSERPWEEFWIAVAGPAVNVVIAVVLAFVLAVGIVLGSLAFLETICGQFLWFLTGLNILMVLFNMLPAFPMDGGRVLRAVLASVMGQLPATRIAVGLATGFAVLFGALGVFGMLTGMVSPFLALIGLLIYFAGQQELYMLRMRQYQRAVQAEYAAAYEQQDRPRYQPVYPPRPVQVWVLDNDTGVWVKQ